MPAVPEEIGPYRVLRLLGRGGMGTVLLAADPRLDRRVALKLFSGPEAGSAYAREHLQREARAAAALSHPNIAAVYDVQSFGSDIVIVFEYVEGETLAARIAQRPLSIAIALDLALQLADAVAAAHARGIVHRDLKPSNVIITSEGRLKVLDFGIARSHARESAIDTAGPTTTGFVGTVGYASPEQCLGELVDARSDVFSLAVVLFEMLTGRRPFPGGDATTILRAMLQDAPPRLATVVAGVPEALDRLVVESLSRDPGRRPQSAGEFRDRLRAIASANGYGAIGVSRRHVLAAVLLLLSALGIGALVSSLVSNRRPSQHVRPPVVAVLPLTNASGDASKDYLALGVAESLITRLAALPSVTVLSRSAVADARSRGRSLQAVASELDATFLVDGTVQQAGEEVLISLNLARADASVVWADTAEGPFNRIFELQAGLASALGEALSVQLSAADRVSLTRQPTMNSDALAAYWRGKALLDRRDVKGNVEAALAAFDHAVALDPSFADAHAGRGEALWARYVETNDVVWAQQAIAAGTEALRLGPERSHVRYALAVTLEGSGRLDEAVDELRRALVLQPNYDDARRRLGQVLARQGKIDEAVAEFQKAIALRPAFWGHHNALGTSLIQAARYKEAIDPLRRVTELQPDAFIGYHQLGTAHSFMGEYDAALAQFNLALERNPNAQTLSNLGAIHHLRGDYSRAEEAYRQALKLRPNSDLTYRNLGDALRRQRKEADARRAYEQAVTLTRQALQVNPKDAGNMSALAVYLAKLGRADEAITTVRQARALQPQDARVMFREGVVYALCGQRAQALDALREAVQRGYSRKSIAEEEDLIPLRNDPAFQSVIKDKD